MLFEFDRKIKQKRRIPKDIWEINLLRLKFQLLLRIQSSNSIANC